VGFVLAVKVVLNERVLSFLDSYDYSKECVCYIYLTYTFL